MKCCAECFFNPSIQFYINSISDEIGKCDFCKSENTALLESKELFDFLSPLLEMYTSTHEGKPSESSLLNELKLNWKLFSEQLNDKEADLLEDIIPHEEKWDQIKKSNVIIDFLINPDENPLIVSWEHFKQEIMYENRFFFESFKPKQLENILKHEELTRLIGVGTKLYRGRLQIDEKSTYDIDNMGKPPAHSSSEGRANPRGIPYLYVSLEPETVVYEIRATHFDTITIAEFEVLNQLKILTIKSMDIFRYDPFSFEEDIVGIFQAMLFLSTLDDELSKPMRRGDSELEYLPTQYICEFAKQLGFDGIQYASTVNHGGTNIAIFNDDKLKCNKVTDCFVTDIKIEFNYHA